MKTTFPLVSTIKSPPVVGRTYRVPCVEYGGFWVPVNGPAHDDKELGQTQMRHWHADIRFMTDLDIRNIDQHPERIEPPTEWRPGGYGFDFAILIACKGQKRRLQSLKCLRNLPDYSSPRKIKDGGTYQYHAGKTIDDHGRVEDSLEGRTLQGPCRRCPHKGLPLANVVPENGVIYCPGHGFGFDAKTGQLVRRTVKHKNGSYGYKMQGV